MVHVVHYSALSPEKERKCTRRIFSPLHLHPLLFLTPLDWLNGTSATQTTACVCKRCGGKSGTSHQLFH